MNDNTLSATYRGFTFVLNHGQKSLDVFEKDGSKFMTIPLINPDDLIRAICICRESVDDFLNDRERSKTLFG